MQRIETLLQKISDLAQRGNKATVIEIDLMMDYTRVLYADLIEWRARSVFNTSLELNEPTATPIPEAGINDIKTEIPVKSSEAIVDHENNNVETIPANNETQQLTEAEVPDNQAPNKSSETIPSPPTANVVPPEIQQPKNKPNTTAQQLFTTEKPTERKKRDIRQHIGINDKYQLISELFSNNKNAYETMLDKINEFASYDEAVQWLKNNTYQQYNWQDDSAGLMILYGILMLFFSDNK